MAVWCCSVCLAVRLERDLMSYRGLPRNPCYGPELPRFKYSPRGDEYSAGLSSFNDPNLRKRMSAGWAPGLGTSRAWNIWRCKQTRTLVKHYLFFARGNA